MSPEEIFSQFNCECRYALNLKPFASTVFYLIFTCVDPDPYSDYESGSTKSLNMDPIRIRIHNTGTNRILIFSVGTGTGTSLLNSCEFSTGIILANSRHIISQQYSPQMRNIFAESFLERGNTFKHFPTICVPTCQWNMAKMVLLVATLRTKMFCAKR